MDSHEKTLLRNISYLYIADENNVFTLKIKEKVIHLLLTLRIE